MKEAKAAVLTDIAEQSAPDAHDRDQTPPGVKNIPQRILKRRIVQT